MKIVQKLVNLKRRESLEIQHGIDVLSVGLAGLIEVTEDLDSVG